MDYLEKIKNIMNDIFYEINNNIIIIYHKSTDQDLFNIKVEDINNDFNTVSYQIFNNNLFPFLNPIIYLQDIKVDRINDFFIINSNYHFNQSENDFRIDFKLERFKTQEIEDNYKIIFTLNYFIFKIEKLNRNKTNSFLLLKDLKEDINELKDDINEIKDTINDINEHLEKLIYAPLGPMYNEAKKDFDKLIN